MRFGMIGLGRMGANMVRRLLRDGHQAVVYDHLPATVTALVDESRGGHSPGFGADERPSPIAGVGTLEELVATLAAPRVIFIMVPAAHVGATVERLAPLLAAGDVLIDGGNSHYQDDLTRSERLAASGVAYLDMGTSGGVWGLERGYCLMIGGDRVAVERLDPLFRSLAPGRGTIPPTPGREADGEATTDTADLGYLHCGPSGAGHFVKMIHNGIEYGLMAAYAEGFNILSKANIGKASHAHDAETTPLRHPEHYQYDFDLAAISELWRRGSVITSWLLDLTATALRDNPTLAGFAGRVSDSGEGRWTIAAANDEAVPAHVLTAALFERFASRGEDDFQNRVLSAMRLGFGGHKEKQS